MNVKKGLGVLTLAGLLSLTGCAANEHKQGVVLEEHGSIVGLEESPGALFGNESVKVSDPSYLLVVDTPDGDYLINVFERRKPLNALEKAIVPGETTILFKTVRSDIGSGHHYFSADRIGSLPSREIVVIDRL